MPESKLSSRWSPIMQKWSGGNDDRSLDFARRGVVLRILKQVVSFIEFGGSMNRRFHRGETVADDLARIGACISGGSKGGRSTPRQPRCMTLGRRNTRGLNHGRESSKVIQDCMIRHVLPPG